MKYYLFLAVLFFAIGAGAQSPSLILFNGKVFTANDEQKYVTAIAIRENYIMALGTNSDIKKLASGTTKLIDLKGKTVVPGFNDAHFHSAPYFIGYTIPYPQDGTQLTWQQQKDSILKAVKLVPKGTFIYMPMGEDVGTDTTIDRFVLDKLAPDHPLLLEGYWGHVIYFNTLAIKALGFTEKEPDMKGGFFGRIPATQLLNGRAYENANVIITRRKPSTEQGFLNSMRDLGNQALYFGVTSIQNMCTVKEPADYIAVLKKQPLPIRFRLIRWPQIKSNDQIMIPSRDHKQIISGLPLVYLSGTKWILDGTPIERLACTTTEYKDRAGWYGQLDYSKKDIRNILEELKHRNDQPLFHVVGDSTIRFVLQELSKNQEFWSKRSVRFEHGDGLLPDRYPLARKLGITIVQNPSHFTIVSYLHRRYSGAMEHESMGLKSLIKAGIPVAIGSDGPLNPYLNIMFACMHPFRPSEALTVEEAVTAYTKGSAGAEGMKNKGVLKKGNLADLVVLSQDIFSIPLPQLPATHSLLTIVNGRIAYQEKIE